MRTARDLAQRNKVTVKWADDQRTTRTLHFLVQGPQGGTRAGFFVHIKDLFAELEIMGAWAMIGIPTKSKATLVPTKTPGLAFRIANSLLNAEVIVETASAVDVQELVRKCLEGLSE